MNAALRALTVAALAAGCAAQDSADDPGDGLGPFDASLSLDGAAPAPDGSVPDPDGPDAASPDAEDGGPTDGSAPLGPPEVEIVAQGLVHPWAVEPLPDGRLLVTERPGRLRIVHPDGRISEPVSGVPAVFASGQGGLLDILRSPQFEEEGLVWFCYAAQQGRASGTEVAVARLDGEALTGVQVIFRVNPKTTGGSNHYGCRLAFDRSGALMIGVGDRFNQLEEAQVLDNHLGKVMRVLADGGVPSDNPFVGREGVPPEIWSYGHRNIQGMATHPVTGEVWISEHGPAGGDEVNLPRAGENHGWPLASYGRHYDGRDIPNDHAGQGFTEPVHFWTPSIAPSGLLIYGGDMFPEWRGQIFSGALAGQRIVRLEMDGTQVLRETNMLEDRGWRIRDLAEGPNGAIWFVTDSRDGIIGRIIRR